MDQQRVALLWPFSKLDMINRLLLRGVWQSEVSRKLPVNQGLFMTKSSRFQLS